jgi:hypothetical protein
VQLEETADAAPLLKHPVPGAEHDVPDGCAECVRLSHQARAAMLTGDRSRLCDVRVYQHRHLAAEHSEADTA